MLLIVSTKFHFELAKTMIGKSFFHPDEILLELLLIVKYFKRKVLLGSKSAFGVRSKE